MGFEYQNLTENNSKILSDFQNKIKKVSDNTIRRVDFE